MDKEMVLKLRHKIRHMIGTWKKYKKYKILFDIFGFIWYYISKYLKEMILWVKKKEKMMEH